MTCNLHFTPSKCFNARRLELRDCSLFIGGGGGGEGEGGLGDFRRGGPEISATKKGGSWSNCWVMEGGLAILKRPMFKMEKLTFCRWYYFK